MSITGAESSQPTLPAAERIDGIVHLLSGGAAQGLVESMENSFLPNQGIRVQGRFDAVGAMKNALLEGVPCDVAILTAQLIQDLQQAGHLIAGSEAVLGEVETGIAVLQAEAPPDVSTRAALKEALLQASAIYFPDPARATAGIHFSSVLNRLGIADQVRARLRPFPNGLTAMRELVRDGQPGAIGCTQVTEIRYTPGVTYVSGLPAGCELKTVYVAAITQNSRQHALAQRFIALLAGSQTAADRRRLGFNLTVA